ncbi:M56 family metallopeptidase [Mucilaginibacter sp. UR6-11]|uniref:M56 family metallopeptidase n=1 Tax=Mucilaginibacter sp. UR6-11 TaxID=1435644 RepID=UPI001E63652D|nr:M56 family metallopeptidase [Mucilaginibacter sp. UR6-11]MCC8426700.1 TonB family protein [Mucilaginibacter sp. UR6-11]
MNWLYYLAEANIYLGVFYLAYRLFLTKETYYQLTRAYLLFACVASFILPLLQIGALRPVENAVTTTVNYTVPQEYYAPRYHEVQQPVNKVKTIAPATPALPPVAVVNTLHQASPVVTETKLTPQEYLVYAYIAGAAVLLMMLIVKLYTLFKLTRKAKLTDQGEYKLVYLPGTNTAFSFFNYLFIGTDASGTDTIIRHELVHIRQKHSADIMFLEVLKVVNWFNPFVYLLQNSLKNVHEYIADEKTAAYETDALAYSSFLVNNAYGTSGSSITHSFFNYNLLKKRIIMLNQKRSGNLARLKYLVIIPICAALLCCSTLSFSKTYALVDLDPIKGSGFKALSNKSAHKTYTNKNVVVDEAPIKLSATDNGDIAHSGYKFEADTLALDKNTRIVDEDHPPIPMESAGGYDKLNRYLLKNIHYKPAGGDKGGLVVISFTVGPDRKITDPKIATSDGEVRDSLALNAFKNYQGIVNDDEGKTLKIGVFFFTDDYSIFKRPFENDPGNSGWVTVTKYGFNPPRTSKGYEYAEWFTGGHMVNGKLEPTVSKVRFYDKNDQELNYSTDTATPEDIKLLKNKYGYVFPSNAYWGLEGGTKSHNYLANSMDVYSYLSKPYTAEFYNHILTELKYPEKEKSEATPGAVLLKFELDQNGTISDWAVAKSGGEDFDQAALDVARSFDGTINDKAGAHTIAVVFCTVQNGKRPKVDENWKKTTGYVGEVARGESKPIMISFSMPKKQ